MRITQEMSLWQAEPFLRFQRLNGAKGNSMRHCVMPGLLALVASTIYVQASTPAPPQAQQPFRKLEYSRIGPWEVAAIGNDEKVNHCALARGTASPDPKAGEPKFLMLVDKESMILRLRAAEY